jgi:hypothetical protein
MWRVDVDVVGDIKSLRQELPNGIALRANAVHGKAAHKQLEG